MSQRDRITAAQWKVTLAALVLVQALAGCNLASSATSQRVAQPQTTSAPTPTAASPIPTPRPTTTAISTVYAGSNRGLVALDAHTGAVRWRYLSLIQAPIQVYTIAEGMLYGGVADTAGAVTLVALDTRTGATHWRLPFARGTPPGTVAGQAGILYTIYAEVAHGWLQDWALYALDAKSGHLLWRHSFGLDFISDPIMGTGILYFLRANPVDETNTAAGSNVIVYALDARTGIQRWQALLKKTDIGDVAVSSQALYLLAEGVDAGSAYALDATDGHLLYHSFAGYLGSSWSLANGTLYGCKGIPANPFGPPPAHIIITALDAANG